MKNDDLNIRNKSKAVNRGRGEAGETIYSRQNRFVDETLRIHHRKKHMWILELLEIRVPGFGVQISASAVHTPDTRLRAEAASSQRRPVTILFLPPET
jgi:hypothetical protein